MNKYTTLIEFSAKMPAEKVATLMEQVKAFIAIAIGDNDGVNLMLAKQSPMYKRTPPGRDEFYAWMEQREPLSKQAKQNRRAESEAEQRAYQAERERRLKEQAAAHTHLVRLRCQSGVTPREWSLFYALRDMRQLVPDSWLMLYQTRHGEDGVTTVYFSCLAPSAKHMRTVEDAIEKVISSTYKGALSVVDSMSIPEGIAPVNGISEAQFAAAFEGKAIPPGEEDYIRIPIPAGVLDKSNRLDKASV